MNQRPNILWICTDQQRADTIGALGNLSIRTPHLDRLCTEGVAFERAYCQAPVCTPSRSSFMTGLYPSAVHGNINGNARLNLPADVQLITRRLADAGYRCGLAGKLHLASAFHGVEDRGADGYTDFWYSHGPTQNFGQGNQYTDWLERIGQLDAVIDRSAYDPVQRKGARYRANSPASLHQTTWCCDRAIEFIQTHRDQPWLMSVNIFDPHPPFDPPQSYQQRYAGLAEPWASYYAQIELIDENIGRLLATVERENTVVIFMSDHGDMLGEHGLHHKGPWFYEGLVRVPLIISWPGMFRQGLRVSGLVELTDLAPTLAELTGRPVGWTHGQSLLPILRGERDPCRHREFVRCEFYGALEGDSTFATMYRDEQYKLVVHHGNATGQLFDLSQDPGETCNLWDDLAVRCRLLKMSFDAAVRIGDPGSVRIGRY